MHFTISGESMSKFFRPASLAALALTVLWGLAPQGEALAQTPAGARTDFGVILMAHGGSPEWDREVLAAIAPLKDRHRIEPAFGMADPVTIQDAARKLEAEGVKRIGVVRLFISGESWHERTEQILGLRPGAPARPAPAAADPHAGHGGGGHHDMALWKIDTKASFALTTQGLAEAPAMGAIMADRAKALSRKAESEDVLIFAHGPGDDAENARWISTIDARAEAVRKAAPFRRVEVMTLREDWPDKRPEAERRARAFVERAKTEGGVAIVLPFRLQGFGPYKEVLKGLEYTSDGHGLLPHPNVTRWIDEQIGALDRGPFQTPR
jgi:sirohydrochlorin cobaltochelatase